MSNAETQNLAARHGTQLLLRDGLLVSSPLVAHLDALTFRAASEAGNVTDLSSPARWRELQAGGAVAVTLRAEGYVTGGTASAALMSRALAGSADNYRLNYDATHALAGPFIITELFISAAIDAPQELRLTLESAGALTFTTS